MLGSGGHYDVDVARNAPCARSNLVDAIGGTQAFALRMQSPPRLAALCLHAPIQRELGTRAADLAGGGGGGGDGVRRRLLHHARWGRCVGGRLRDCGRIGGARG